MDKKYKISLLLLLLVMIFAFINQLYIGDLSLEDNLHTENIETIEENKTYYLGYTLKWSGNVNPVIKDIKFYKDNQEIDNETIIKAYIDKKGALVSFEARPYEYFEKNNMVKLITPKDYKFENKRATLVTKINTEFINELEEVNKLQIEYSILNSKRTTVFKFDALKLGTGHIRAFSHVEK